MFKQNLKKEKIFYSSSFQQKKQTNNNFKFQACNKKQLSTSPVQSILKKKVKMKQHYQSNQYIKNLNSPLLEKNRFKNSRDNNSNNQKEGSKIKNEADSFQPQYDSTAPEFFEIYINKKCSKLIEDYKKQKQKTGQNNYQLTSKNKFDSQLQEFQENLFFQKKSRTKLQSEGQIKRKLKEIEVKYLSLQYQYKNILIEAKSNLHIFQSQKQILNNLKQKHFQDQMQLQNLSQKVFSKTQKNKSTKTYQQAIQVTQSQIIQTNKKKINQNQNCRKKNHNKEKQQRQPEFLNQERNTQMNWFQIQKKKLIQKSKEKRKTQCQKNQKKILNLSRFQKQKPSKPHSITDLHSKSVKQLKKSRIKEKQQTQLLSVKRDLFNVKQHIQNLQRFKKNTSNATNNLIKMRQQRKNKQNQFERFKVPPQSKFDVHNNQIKNLCQQRFSNNSNKNQDLLINEKRYENQEDQIQNYETPIAKLIVKKERADKLPTSKYRFKPSNNFQNN